jgi:hypothetical protein
MIALLLQFGPWIVGALGVVYGVIKHYSANAKVATVTQQASDKVNAANANVQGALDNLNARKTADVQADADASKTAATAAKERTNVENAQAALGDDAAREQLIGLLHGSATVNPGSGKGSAGTDPGRG